MCFSLADRGVKLSEKLFIPCTMCGGVLLCSDSHPICNK